MIRKKPRIGKRINIIVLGHIDNDQTAKLYALFEKYGIKSRVEFAHYGRPNKAKRELDSWFTKNFGEDNIMNKLERADKELFGDSFKEKMERADKNLYDSARKIKQKFKK